MTHSICPHHHLPATGDRSCRRGVPQRETEFSRDGRAHRGEKWAPCQHRGSSRTQKGSL